MKLPTGYSCTTTRSAEPRHDALTTLFRDQAGPKNDKSWKNQARRSLGELPYHTSKPKRLNESYALARDAAFLAAQAAAVPNDPNFPLVTIRYAIRGAIADDDAPMISEFCLSHAFRRESLWKRSPLDLLGRGNITEAIQMAETHSPDDRFVWLLLLLRDSYDRGDNASLPRL